MLAPAPIAEHVEYRIALIQAPSLCLLTLAGLDNSAHLLRVSIPTRTRLTSSIHEALKSAWNVRGLVVDYLPCDAGGSPCAVVELLSPDWPGSLNAADLDRISEDELSAPERSSLLSILSRQDTGSLARVGWLHQAIRWIEETAGEKIRSLAEIKQLNAGAQFALLYFPMQSGRSYWLKATGEPNKHEQEVTLFLSKLCPRHLPEVLGMKPEWNAWIMRDRCTTGVNLLTEPGKRFQALECAVRGMAELQRRSIGCEAELLAAGAFDQRIRFLRTDSELLFERISEAMSLQTSTKAPRIDGMRLREVRDIFDAVCDLLETLPIPATVLHGDMHAGNVLYEDNNCRFIDWCEAYVGHPLVTLQHLLLLNQPEDVQLKSTWDRILIDRYRTVMNEACDPGALDQAIVCMPLIAAASAMYGRGQWLQDSFTSATFRPVWIRTLARYMDRAARELDLLAASSSGRPACAG